jgi:hypothetical protein
VKLMPQAYFPRKNELAVRWSKQGGLARENLENLEVGRSRSIKNVTDVTCDLQSGICELVFRDKSRGEISGITDFDLVSGLGISSEFIGLIEVDFKKPEFDIEHADLACSIPSEVGGSSHRTLSCRPEKE